MGAYYETLACVMLVVVLALAAAGVYAGVYP